MATERQDPPMTQTEREAAADFEASVDGHAATLAEGGEAAAERPRSMEDLETAAGGEEDDGQFFVFEQGRKVTLGTLIGRNVPVTYEVKLTGKVLRGPGSLIAFSEPDVMLVVPSRGGKVEVDPVYAEDGSVKEVHVRQNIKARTFYDARTDAASAALNGE